MQLSQRVGPNRNNQNLTESKSVWIGSVLSGVLVEIRTGPDWMNNTDSSFGLRSELG